MHIAEVRLAIIIRATRGAIREFRWLTESVHARQIAAIIRVITTLTWAARIAARAAAIDVRFVTVRNPIETTGARIEVGHPAKINEIRHIDRSGHIGHIAHIDPGRHIPRTGHPLILEITKVRGVRTRLPSIGKVSATTSGGCYRHGKQRRDHARPSSSLDHRRLSAMRTSRIRIQPRKYGGKSRAMRAIRGDTKG